jgi:CheY-like chemotaxis protein
MVDQFRRILQREGFDIFAASIPLEAEAMASGLHPTLIIMDVNFAEGQGWEILTRLKQRDDTRDIPVVVVTLSQDDAQAEALGVFTFIKRPFVPEQLTDAVLAAEQESRVDRILIIDDQPESVRVLHDLLTEQGHYKVFSAASAMDGMSMVARRRPDLVILDLRMPEMDGFDLISELRSNPETASIPIIIVTGDTLNPDEQQQLKNLPVIFKADINAGQRDQFIEGVKTRLGRTNGDT